MQPLTSKELNYLCDMLGMEDSLVKSCAVTGGIAGHPEVRRFTEHYLPAHQARHEELLRVLEQHEHVAH
jgi:spore coat protein CotF